MAMSEDRFRTQLFVSHVSLSLQPPCQCNAPPLSPLVLLRKVSRLSLFCFSFWPPKAWYSYFFYRARFQSDALVVLLLNMYSKSLLHLDCIILRASPLRYQWCWIEIKAVDLDDSIEWDGGRSNSYRETLPTRIRTEWSFPCFWCILYVHILTFSCHYQQGTM